MTGSPTPTASDPDRQIADLRRKVRTLDELYATAALALAAYRIALIAMTGRER